MNCSTSTFSFDGIHKLSYSQSNAHGLEKSQKANLKSEHLLSLLKFSSVIIDMTVIQLNLCTLSLVLILTSGATVTL